MKKVAIIGDGPRCIHLVDRIRAARHSVNKAEVVAVLTGRDSRAGESQPAFHGIPAVKTMEELRTVDGLDMLIDTGENAWFTREQHRIIPSSIKVVDYDLADMIWPPAGKAETEASGSCPDSTHQVEKERMRFRQILDSLPDAVLLIDRDRNLEWVNGRFQDIMGETNMKIGEKFMNPFCCRPESELFDDTTDFIAEVAERGEPIQYIHFEPGDATAERYFRVIITPIMDENNQVDHIVETVRPITEVVQQTRQVERNERYLRQFIENAHEMITMKDGGGRYILINQHAAGLFGLTPMDCIGRTDHDILPGYLADILTVKDKEILNQKTFKAYEERIEFQGETHYLETVRFPIVDYKAEVTGVASMSRDVTEQKQLQKAFVRSEKMAAIGKLAASVAHEINNPLTGILSFAEELKMDAEEADPEASIIHDYNVIIRETIRCRKIVSDLLEFARLEQPQHQLIDLSEIVRRCLSLIEKQAAFHDIRFNLELAPDLPDVDVDPNQMQQVFLNLIINAAEAMEYVGTITIATRNTEDGKFAAADVIDNGPGIPLDMQTAIFEPFVTTKGSKGYGLGLSAVQTIVEQHGGMVELESRIGQGARFRIKLPLHSRKKGV